MFRAKCSNGQDIFLNDVCWSKALLTKMRKSYTFHCLICAEEVVLKLGERKAWHFSHRQHSLCTDRHYRNESEDHKIAKLEVYRWLDSYKLEPKIEHYLEDVRQRPDVYVKVNNRKLALELQLSYLNKEQFLKRYFSYKDHDYETVWIGILRKPIQRKSFYYPLSHVDFLLIRPSPFPHAIYYSLVTHRWIVFSNFFYVTPRKTFVRVTPIPLTVSPHCLFFNLDVFLTETKKDQYNRLEEYIAVWKSQTIKVRTARHPTLTKAERNVLHLLQRHNMALNYFPAICNIPLLSQYICDSAPYLWQTWVVIGYINSKPLGETFSLSQLTQWFITNHHQIGLSFRLSVLHVKQHIRQLLSDYLNVLCRFNVLEKKAPGNYKLIHYITISKPFHTLLDDDKYIINQLLSYFENNNI
jgi:competence CoiA-like predicted nuclease